MTPLLAVSQSTAVKVRTQIVGCEQCKPDTARLPLPRLLDAVTGLAEATTDYVLPEALKCPRCFATIDEGTLVVRR